MKWWHEWSRWGAADWSALFAGLAAVGSFGGIAAWRVMRRQEAESRVEREIAAADREEARHLRLTPLIEVAFGRVSDEAARIVVRHLANSPARVVDELHIRIVNDTPFRPADGPVWGPWRLARGADNADKYGRTADPRTDPPLARGEETLWALTLTDDPNSGDTGQWRISQEENPLKVRLVAVVEGRMWEYPITIHSGQTISPAPGNPIVGAALV